LSLTQIETRTAEVPGGELSREIRESQVYRDGAGRIRVELGLKGPSGEPFAVAQIFNPVEGFIAMLVVSERTAHRLWVTEAYASSSGFVAAIPGLMPDPRRDDTIESLGTRMIEGIEFVGVRTTVAVENARASQPATDERWSSTKLGLIASVESSNSSETYSAKIQGVIRAEPDQALFSIPGDYRIEESREP
jgi:hypothetical protein